MSNVKFSQLPNLGTPTATTIIPVVDGVTNYTVTAANLQSYVNNSTGNITGGNLTATGNVQGVYILGNGSQLTGLPATYGNANVTAFLPTYSGNLNSVSAVPGSAITGTVALATTAGTAGTVTTAAQPNITSVGTLTSATASGNITASYFLGNGSLLTGIAASTYGNANVAAFLPTYTGNLNSVTAVPGAVITGTVANATYAVSAGVASSANTVAGANVSGAVALATTAYSVSAANVVGTVANATYATSAGSATTATNAVTAVTAGTVTTAAQPNITSVGTLTSVAVTGNLSAGNVTTPGNISAAYYTGNGSLLTGVVASNVALISTGNNFANTAVGNGKMWINGGNAIGSLTPTGLADNMFIITNGTGNCYITLGPTGGIVINPATGANVSIGSGTKISSSNFEGGTITATAKINSLGTAGTTSGFNGPIGGPATSTSTGTAGDIWWNASYIYVCTAANTWKRVALTAF